MLCSRLVNSWKDKIVMRLPALLLLLGTVLFWSIYDRYQQTDAILLKNPSLETGFLQRGDVSQTNEFFVLRVPPNGSLAQIRFHLPSAEKYDLLRVEARAKATDIVEGDRPWKCARLLLLQYNAKNKWIPTPNHQLFSKKNGSTRWEKVRKEIDVLPETDHLVLILQQIGKEGTVEFAQIRVYPVKLRSSFLWWRLFFAVAWATLAFFYLPKAHFRQRKLNLLIGLNIVAILFGVLMPADWIKQSAEWAGKTWAEYELKSTSSTPPSASPPSKKITTPANPKLPKPKLEKSNKARKNELTTQMTEEAHAAGHFGLFTSLAFLLFLSFFLEQQKFPQYFKMFGDLLLFAAVTESLQFLTMDRTPGFYDFRLDLYGLTLGFLLFLFLFPLLCKIRQKQKNQQPT